MRLGTAIGILCCLAASCEAQETARPRTGLQRFDYAEPHMGVPFRISVYARDQRAANNATTAAFKRIAALNDVFSDYSTTSEVTRLRQYRVGEPVAVSNDLAKLLGRSLSFSKRTRGAFDVTVGPLVRQWRRTQRRKQLPQADTLQTAKSRSGHQRLQLTGTELRFNVDGMRLDFGAIAKGFACDEAITVLTKHGIASALVDGGGDICLSAAPPGKTGWRIQIEPEKPGEPAPLLVLKNCAVATSGDRYRFVEINGKRYSHIVDPRTGLGLTSRLTVTIVAPNATDADAVASAVSVLGVKDGVKFVESVKGLEGMVRDYSANEPRSRSSPGFGKLVSRSRQQPKPYR